MILDAGNLSEVDWLPPGESLVEAESFPMAGLMDDLICSMQQVRWGAGACRLMPPRLRLSCFQTPQGVVRSQRAHAQGLAEHSAHHALRGADMPRMVWGQGLTLLTLKEDGDLAQVSAEESLLSPRRRSRSRIPSRTASRLLPDLEAPLLASRRESFDEADIIGTGAPAAPRVPRVTQHLMHGRRGRGEG